MRRSSKQSGFTLVELGITVTAIVIGGAFLLGVSSSMQRQSRATATIAGVQQIAQAAVSARPDRNYAAMSITELRNRGAVPDGWFDATVGRVYGPWGGEITVFPEAHYSSSATAPNAVRVRVDDVDNTLCADLARAVAPKAYRVSSHTLAHEIKQLNASPQVQATEANVQAGCASTTNRNAVSFYFDGGAL